MTSSHVTNQDYPVKRMTSPPTDSLRGPIRVLIRTRPAYLQEIHPSFDQADTALIEKLCASSCDEIDASQIRHLITRIADEKRSERVDIIFDYGVPAEELDPEVLAFKVGVKNSRLTVTKLPHPDIKSKVNDTVHWWRGINVKNHITFPSRTDVRRRRRGLEAGCRTSKE
ncbi:hypothetical protein K469DRAFT_702918 [Zopfia rhizophila CBS 207.26]|uniref:Uncharacterized protein n=1 Tax=Zopfia rhizophila CBS 207.26 TaxID=1314779 RepID=A0A6A6DAB4_9PEZI|nr:hypothetical protein K469DRAFT_702918 [Zopfia rhizophila CBS 207.26]